MAGYGPLTYGLSCCRARADARVMLQKRVEASCSAVLHLLVWFQLGKI